MKKVITNIEQVTVEWLTAVLTQSGALTQGHVASFEVDGGRGNWSTNAKLRLSYSPEAQGEMPQRLFLKLVNIDLGDGETFLPSEVPYYTRDYVDVSDAPLIPCYDAASSDALHRYHILLADVSETHTDAFEKEPTLAHGLALAEGLAAMHARWWGANRLAAAGAKMHDARHIKQFVAIAEPGMGHILNHVAHELKPHWPDLMRALFAHHPQALIKRAEDDNGFTIIHGDAGEYNIMVPRVGDVPIYLIDRQPFNWSLIVWLGVYDLAFSMVMDWETAARRTYEIPVLQQYHNRLIQHGVLGYTWQRLFDDYRLCAAMGVYIASEYCRGGLNERLRFIWMRKLQRSLTACDDLKCADLWEIDHRVKRDA
jgi:hypothetical protein